MSHTSSLEGKLFLAMPSMGDPRFERSVIYMCSHDSEGAMGLVINQPLPSLSFTDLLDQLNIPVTEKTPKTVIHSGGPVEPGRGFVLHTADYIHDSTMVVQERLAVTATLDILKDIAAGNGPQQSIMTLGYSGWSAGQLDKEIQQNAWLTADADTELLFSTEPENIWPRAMAMIGVDISMLSSEAGHS